ncbi:MAG: glycosyl transferase [Betaproteobacteria bacterium]|nr:glycosyl transferase [Betaproteobacteria bacterium]
MAAIFFSSVVVCAALIGFLLLTKLAWRIATDVPNNRSLHTTPIPRVGGWGVVPAMVGVSLYFGLSEWIVPTLAVVLFAVSYADDRLGLPIIVRLPVHAAAAAAWLAFGPLGLPFATAALAVFAIVWVTNLFNFMDGADGLAGGMAVFAFGTYAIVAGNAGAAPLALWAASIAGAAAGFLLFNVNPARVFLGDAGSITIGFFAGAFGIWGWAAETWPVWFPFLVSAPFFLDATATILRRMFGGEPFWRAHREHYYQRLIRSGWSHRRTAICEYVLMGASAGLAMLMLDWAPAAQYAGLVGVAAVYVMLAWAVDRRWAVFQHQASVHKAIERSVVQGAAALHKRGVPRASTQHGGYIGEAIKISHLDAASAVPVAGRQHHTRTPVDDRAFQHDSENTEAKFKAATAVAVTRTGGHDTCSGALRSGRPALPERPSQDDRA